EITCSWFHGFVDKDLINLIIPDVRRYVVVLTGSGRLPNQPFKKQNSNVKNPPMVENKSKHEEKLHAGVNNLKDLGTSGVTEEKLNQKNGKISSKVTDDLEGKILKNSKDGGSAKFPDNKKLGNNGSCSAKLLDLVAIYTLAKGKAKSRIALDSIANNKESNEEQSSEGKIIKVQRMMVLQNGQIISNRAIAVAGKIW
nr:bromo adjacent homology (BAH) domain protein [Tanacetum cinerariifolium]